MPPPSNPLVVEHIVEWNKVDEFLAGLDTKRHHKIQVRREAIPLVFVPGIMGSHLRRKGLPRDGEDKDGIPNLRWSTDTGWVLSNLALPGPDGAKRRRMMIGTPQQTFNPDYLEVDEAKPPHDGFQGIMKAYHEFLEKLRAKSDWEGLEKYFVFPVYAVGYNWMDDVHRAGKYLADRIDAIIAESKKVTGLCEKVILITHSMGGLVSRSASELNGAQSKIVGIVHGVQPVNGSPAAYWRIKAGFEGSDSLGLVQRALGNDGTRVTPILGNMPGGLTLLPNKLYRNNKGEVAWLQVKRDGKDVLALPKSDPYAEIYRIKGRPKPKKDEKPSSNNYWGLVDPDLLNPENTVPEGGNRRDRINAELNDPWPAYLRVLDKAEALHNDLSPDAGPKHHPQTLCVAGTGHKTADNCVMIVESNWVRSDPYPTQGFRGFFTDPNGDDMQAVLQDPAGKGDGTVPFSSATALHADGRPEPKDFDTDADHQGAYGNDSAKVQEWAIKAITTMAKFHYKQKRGKGGSAK
ncbi:MAG: lipase family alpha/beta hydrolase [Bryobacteraceae bacterium]